MASRGNDCSLRAADRTTDGGIYSPRQSAGLWFKRERGIYAASKSVERLEFRAFVKSRDLAKKFPSVLGFGFIERVEQIDFDKFSAVDCTMPFTAGMSFANLIY